MKYLSIDIETTGLNANTDQILQLAAVLEDTQKQVRVEELPYFQCNVWHPQYHGNATALSMNAEILKQLGSVRNEQLDGIYEQGKAYTARFDNLFSIFREWCKGVGLLEKDDTGKQINIVAAGKNAASFDIPFITKLPMYVNILKHRVLDPTMYFIDWKNDMVPPESKECCKRAGIEYTNEAHTALWDARMVIQLLRAGYAYSK